MNHPFLRRAIFFGIVTVSLVWLVMPRLSFAEPVALRQRPRSTDNLSWGRSPFALVAGTERGASGFNLTGILWDPKTPQAIINDTVVGVGDRISGQTVIAIESDKVILNDGIQSHELRME